jgi:hypothetical protein
VQKLGRLHSPCWELVIYYDASVGIKVEEVRIEDAESRIVKILNDLIK